MKILFCIFLSLLNISFAFHYQYNLPKLISSSSHSFTSFSPNLKPILKHSTSSLLSTSSSNLFLEVLNDYQVLGLSEGASYDDVKSAYTRLKAIWNPERFRGEDSKQEEAKKRTERLNKAFSNLTSQLSSQSEKDDNELELGGDLDLFDLLSSFTSNFNPSIKKKKKKTKLLSTTSSNNLSDDIEIQTTIPFITSIYGGELTLNISRTEECPVCNGQSYIIKKLDDNLDNKDKSETNEIQTKDSTTTSSSTSSTTSSNVSEEVENEENDINEDDEEDNNNKYFKCQDCQGTGMIRKSIKNQFSSFLSLTTCPNCYGLGVTNKKNKNIDNNIININDDNKNEKKIKCSNCLLFHGKILKNKEIKLPIPYGVTSGQTLRIKNEGNLLSKNKNKRGDLYITLSCPSRGFPIPKLSSSSSSSSSSSKTTLSSSTSTPFPTTLEMDDGGVIYYTRIENEEDKELENLTENIKIKNNKNKILRDEITSNDLLRTFSISLIQATLGDDIVIKLLNNKKIKLSIPPGIQNDDVLKFSGLGSLKFNKDIDTKKINKIDNKDSNDVDDDTIYTLDTILNENEKKNRGDLYIRFKVNTPRVLSTKEKKLLQELREEEIQKNLKFKEYYLKK